MTCGNVRGVDDINTELDDPHPLPSAADCVLAVAPRRLACGVVATSVLTSRTLSRIESKCSGVTIIGAVEVEHATTSKTLAPATAKLSVTYDNVFLAIEDPYRSMSG
jgi:hypothetical protein